MKLNKILYLFVILTTLSLTGCSTLDMMVGLKEKDNKDVADMTELSDFEIVDDSISEEAVETITITTQIEEKTTNILGYYEDSNGFVVPVNTKIPWEEGIAKATLRSMIIGSDTEKKIAQSGLHGVIPQGTEIRGMSIKDGVCKVDFTKNILNTQSIEQEENMISAITYSLTEFPTINKVEILVDGQALAKLSKGYDISSSFERKNINLHGSKDEIGYTVYYKAPDTEVAGHYVPITISSSKVDNPVAVVLENLFSGAPKDTQLSNMLPLGVNFRGVTLLENKAVINLGVNAVNMTQEQYDDMNAIVVLCLEQFEKIEKVEYKIEGISFKEAGLDFNSNNVMPVFNQY